MTGASGEPERPAARDVITRLQHALLPAGLPVLPRAQIAARYLPAGRGGAPGGDWFDAVVLPGGLVALIVGDVAGGGLAASAAMGQLRAVLNDLLASGLDLAAALRQAGAFAARTSPLFAATVAVAVLDPASGLLRYGVCGHPAPLITGPGAGVRFLDGGRSGPLGTGSAPVLATAALAPGELVMLYSDGLTGRPGCTTGEARTELATAAANAAASQPTVDGSPADADRVCELTVEQLAGAGRPDDITVLAARRLAVPAPALHLTLPARRSSLGEARREFGEWLAGVAPLADGQDALQLGLGEVIANAVEHAYPPGTAGTVEIDAEVGADGVLECRVTDHGHWREPGPGADRGNGLMLAANMAGELLVSHPRRPAAAANGTAGGGTVVTMRRRLVRPAMLAPVPDARDGAVPGPALRVDITATGHAVLSGLADGTTTERLAGRLLAACRGGTVPLAADLTSVTCLTSAAVQVLFQVRDRLAAHGQELTLIAAPGSPASAVLDLVCLPYAAARG